MPLSEHEQRALEQIERALYADDPKFAATVRGIDPQTFRRRRYMRAAIACVIGLAALSLGVVFRRDAITVAGVFVTIFALLYAGVAWRQVRDQAAAQRAHPAGTVVPTAARGRRSREGRRPEVRRGLMERIEDRWNRRREDLGR